MNEEFKNENPPVSPQAEPDVVALIKKIQQQLVFLEKKIDILINQSQGASSKERFFSKPYRSFDHYKKKTYDNPRGSDFGHERHFEKRHGDENRGFGQKKKPFFHKRRDRGSAGR